MSSAFLQYTNLYYVSLHYIKEPIYVLPEKVHKLNKIIFSILIWMYQKI